MFFCCKCCVLSGRGLCDELIARPEESYRLWCVVVCVIYKPQEWGGHDPRWVAAPQQKKDLILITKHYYNLTTSSPCTVALVQRYVTISNPRRKVCSKLLLPSVTQYYKFTANAYLLQYTRWAKSRYTVYSFYFWWRCDPTWVMTSSFLMFLDHTQWRITFGRTPLDEWSARRRDLYLTTHNTHNRQHIHAPGGIRTHDLSRRAAADLTP